MYGMPGVSQQGVSDQTNHQIDLQIQQLIEHAHNEAYQVLMDNREILDLLASELLEKETLEENELAEIFQKARKLPERPVWLSSENRPVSQEPPVKLPKDKRQLPKPPAKSTSRKGKSPAPRKTTAKSPAKNPTQTATKTKAKTTAKNPAKSTAKKPVQKPASSQPKASNSAKAPVQNPVSPTKKDQ
jgi:cell division protease FtsH